MFDSLKNKIAKKEKTGAVGRDEFAKIYDQNAVKIFRFIYLKTNSKETAEDLTSEVFLRSWKYLQEDREKIKIELDKISSFLYKIARNLLIDHYRKNQQTVEIDEEMISSMADNKQSLLSSIAIKQEVEEVMNMLKRLKEEYQEIILLRFVEELSMEEIAEITGKSEGNLRVLSHRALKSLGSLMEEEGKTRSKKVKK